MKKLNMLLLLLLFAWSLGLSSRLIYQYFIGFPAYTPNLFDVLFDWSGLFVLASVNYLILMYDFFKNKGLLNG